MSRKKVKSNTLTIAGSEALSDAFDMTGYSEMVIVMPDAWTSAAIAFKICDTRGGTYVPLYDASGSLIEATVAVDQAFRVTNVPGPWVKLWSENGGSDEDQGAARSIKVMLKE